MSHNIVVTLGDPAGISGEIVVKAFTLLKENKTKLTRAITRNAKRLGTTFYVAGDYDYLVYSKERLQSDIAIETVDEYLPTYKPAKSILLFPCTAIPIKQFRYGSLAYGRESMAYLDFALTEAKKGRIAALVTAPLTKESVAKHIPGFVGHTDYIAEALATSHYRMAFATPSFLLALQTAHIPLKSVPGTLTVEKVFQSIKILTEAANAYYNETTPLALLGVNPHAGEHGLLGDEEDEILLPAMKKAQAEGIAVEGPFPADSFFIERYKAYNRVLAMYHDSGLIAVKTMFPRLSVNVTIGLPVIRTSVDHGSGYDIAGKGVASAEGLLTALASALHFISC